MMNDRIRKQSSPNPTGTTLQWGIDQLEAALQILKDVAEVWGDRSQGDSPADAYKEIRDAVKSLQGPLSRTLAEHVRTIQRSTTIRTAARAAGARLDSRTRQLINRKFNANGLDGNGRFQKPEHGYSKALDLLSEFDIELGEVVNSWAFQGDSGTINIDVAKKTEDPFSPLPLTNSRLVVSFYRRASDSYEVLAYMS